MLFGFFVVTYLIACTTILFCAVCLINIIVIVYRWNAALAVASFLDSNRHLYVNRNVLELGAGGGLPSIVTVKNGARKVRSYEINQIMTIAHITSLYLPR